MQNKIELIELLISEMKLVATPQLRKLVARELVLLKKRQPSTIELLKEIRIILDDLKLPQPPWKYEELIVKKTVRSYAIRDLCGETEYHVLK